MAYNPWIVISELSISYPDFQWGAVANPDEIDINNSEIVSKINLISTKLNEFFLSTELPYSDNTVITRHIQNKSITSEKIADNSIKTIHIEDGSITNSKLGINCVSYLNLQANSVNSLHLQDGSVVYGKLGIDSVATENIQDQAVTLDKVSPEV